MRNMTTNELLMLIEAVEEGRKQLRIITAAYAAGTCGLMALEQAMERMGALYEILPTQQLAERVVESSTIIVGRS